MPAIPLLKWFSYFKLTAQAAIASTFAYYCANVIYNFYFHPLRNIGGPKVVLFLPQIVAEGMGITPKAIYRLNRWHEKYGSVIRIGPSLLSIANPQVAKEILSTKDLEKSDSFIRFFGEEMGNMLMISVQSDEKHRILRNFAVNRSFPNVLDDQIFCKAPHFSVRSVGNLEPVIGKIYTKLSKKLHAMLLKSKDYEAQIDVWKEMHHYIVGT